MPVTSEPLWEDLVLAEDITLPADGVMITEPLYVGFMETKTFYVKTTTNCNVYVLMGTIPEDCVYLLKSGTKCDTEDSDRAWTCSNESITFQIAEHCTYISLVVEENGSADSTVSIAIS